MSVRQSLGIGAPEPSLGLQGQEEGRGNKGGVKLTKTRSEQPQGTHYSKEGCWGRTQQLVLKSPEGL